MADQNEKISRKFEEADQVLGNRGNMSSARSDVMLCMPCSKKSRQTAAAVYCQTCKEFQCSDCSQIHEVYAFMKTHKLVDTTEAETHHLPFDMKGLDQCDQHQKVLKFFCEDENQLCCSTCAIVDHRKCHSVLEIQKFAGRSASTSSKLKARFQEVKTKAEMIVENAKSTKNQLGQGIKGISLKIRKMRENVTKMFDDLEASVAKDAEFFKTETNEKLTQKVSVNEKYIARATESLETIDNVYKNGTLSQKFIVERKMEKQVNELCSNVDRECQMLESVTVVFDFDETLKLPPLPVSYYVPGRLTLKYYIPEAVQSMALKDPIIKLTKITFIDLNQTGDEANEPLYSGLDFLSDGRQVAVDNKNRQCLIYNEKLEKVGSHKLSYTPQGVVVVSEEEVAITCGGDYKIVFLRVSKSNEVSLIRTSKVKTEYDSICLKDEGHFVVGTMDDTVPVRIVSLSGEEKDFSIGFPNKKYPNDSSTCTYIRSNGKVVLVDADEDTVYIYDDVTNTRVVVKDEQIKKARGVAAGHSGCMLVCSKDTNSIVQISPTGRILTSYK